MILTLFYAGATLMQQWRLRSITLGIANRIRDQATVSFHKTCIEGSDGFTSIGASSEECDNYKNCRIVDSLWYHNMLRGVVILPKQSLTVNKWMTFNNLPPSLNPLYSATPIDIESHIDQNTVYILLETNIYPDLEAIENGAEVVTAEKFGKPIAWKIDTNLAVVLQSNTTLFTELIRDSFIKNILYINNYLPIVRIETVNIKGKPLQLLELDSTPIRTLQNSETTDNECRHHVDKLKILSLVANLKGEPSPDDYDKDITIAIGELKPMNGNCVTAKENGSVNNCEISAWVDSVSSEVDKSQSVRSPLKEHSSPEPLPAKCAVSPVKIGNGSIRSENNVSCEKSNILDIPKDALPSPDVSENTTDREQNVTETVSETTVKRNTSVKQGTFDGLDESMSDRKSVKTCNSMASSECHSSQYSTLKRKKRNSDGCKPPNVLVYSESNDIRSNVIETIKKILHPDRYTIYELKTEQLKTSFWIDNTTLLIVCGPTSPQVGSILMEYFLCGGKMLCLCSDVLNMVLPIYRTAEVRESELVQFSYGRWQKIQLMHHIFCYHPSPIKKHFSLDTDEQFDAQAKPPLKCPGSIDLKDMHGDVHRLVVKVLGTEETWNTPSLILATDTNCSGIAVFSQVHLEADPNLYEHDDFKCAALRKSDAARLDIFADLLSSQLGLFVCERDVSSTNMYPNAYFLGRHETKFELLDKLRPQFIHPNTLKTSSLLVKFYGKNEIPKAALENTLPVLLHSCPDDFSTILYFNTLETREIGRLAIYAPIINSTMTLVTNLNMQNGLVVIGRKQTAGVGRHKNQWLSPDGCALFSIQLHIPLSSPLGQRIPLLQHLVSAAIVDSITKSDEYKRLDIRLKWPNDIYVNGNTKIGGLIVNTELHSSTAICNVGIGFNLDNSIPTTCINDVIQAYNAKHNTNMPKLEYERFFANVFNEIEELIYIVQSGDFDHLYDLYYKLWLHSDAEIVIINAKGHKKLATIIGIDEVGYLLVKQAGKEPETVHPDGNTFDILRGLISAKQY